MKKENWEKRFDEEFVSPHKHQPKGITPWNGDLTGYLDEDFVTPTLIKSFIAKEIRKAQEEITISLQRDYKKEWERIIK